MSTKLEESAGHHPASINLFDLIVTNFQTRLLRFIQKLVKDPELSADILQDTFLATYGSLASRGSLEKCANQGEFLADIQPLIYTIARNKAINELRRRKHVQFVPFGNASQSSADMLDWREEFNQSTEYLIANRSGANLESQVVTNDALKRAFDHVGRGKLVALFLHLDGFSYKEIEQITGESMSCVKSKIFRSKQSLRQALLDPTWN